MSSFLLMLAAVANQKDVLDGVLAFLIALMGSQAGHVLFPEKGGQG